MHHHLFKMFHLQLVEKSRNHSTSVGLTRDSCVGKTLQRLPVATARTPILIYNNNNNKWSLYTVKSRWIKYGSTNHVSVTVNEELRLIDNHFINLWEFHVRPTTSVYTCQMSDVFWDWWVMLLVSGRGELVQPTAERWSSRWVTQRWTADEDLRWVFDGLLVTAMFDLGPVSKGRSNEGDGDHVPYVADHWTSWSSWVGVWGRPWSTGTQETTAVKHPGFISTCVQMKTGAVLIKDKHPESTYAHVKGRWTCNRDGTGPGTDHGQVHGLLREDAAGGKRRLPAAQTFTLELIKGWREKVCWNVTETTNTFIKPFPDNKFPRRR